MVDLTGAFVFMFLLIIAAGGVAVAFVVLAYMKQASGRSEGAKCEGCGYPRRGLGTPRCPECGHAWTDARYRAPSKGELGLIFGALIGVPVLLLLLILMYSGGSLF